MTTSDSDTRVNKTASPGRTRLNGVSLRIVLVISFALLPLGLIAVWQTERRAAAALESHRLTLIAQTARAAQPERERILSAFAVARSLAGTIATLRPEGDVCSDLMVQAASTMENEFQFAGHIGLGAVTRCNNLGDEFDFSANPDSQAIFEDPRPNVVFNPSGNATGLPVVIVSQPVYLSDGQFDGFVSISFAGRQLAPERAVAPSKLGMQLVSFNAEGRILTSDTPRDALDSILPADVNLQDLVGRDAVVFTGQTRQGQARDFALAPILENQAYALGSWEPFAPRGTADSLISTSLMFPFLMWLVTLGVTVIALRRQVVQPIKTLHMRMRSFADGRKMLRGNAIQNAPAELREIGAAFENMADQIVRDEAEMEDQLYERELLMLEVHHRVKNNLQLMSSIVNMQIRNASGSEAETALRGVQGRLSSLAKFHQDLYQTSSLSHLRADELLEDLARQMMTMRANSANPIDLRLDLDEVILTPDEASPLAMLATEALTNALKYTGAAPEDHAFIQLSLKQGDAGKEITLKIENSLEPETETEDTPGLGSRLITAFGSQLEAEVDRTHTDSTYVLTVSFASEPQNKIELGTRQGHPAL